MLSKHLVTTPQTACMAAGRYAFLARGEATLQGLFSELL